MEKLEKVKFLKFDVEIKGQGFDDLAENWYGKLRLLTYINPQKTALLSPTFCSR